MDEVKYGAKWGNLISFGFLLLKKQEELIY